MIEKHFNEKIILLKEVICEISINFKNFLLTCLFIIVIIKCFYNVHFELIKVYTNCNANFNCSLLKN